MFFSVFLWTKTESKLIKCKKNEANIQPPSPNKGLNTRPKREANAGNTGIGQLGWQDSLHLLASWFMHYSKPIKEYTVLPLKLTYAQRLQSPPLGSISILSSLSSSSSITAYRWWRLFPRTRLLKKRYKLSIVITVAESRAKSCTFCR